MTVKFPNGFRKSVPTLLESELVAADCRLSCNQQFDNAQLKHASSGSSTFHSLEYGRGQLNHSHAGGSLGLNFNRDTTGFGKWIGDHLKFFAVKPDVLGALISKTFQVGADFVKRWRFGIMAGHNISVLLPIGSGFQGHVSWANTKGKQRNILFSEVATCLYHESRT